MNLIKFYFYEKEINLFRCDLRKDGQFEINSVLPLRKHTQNRETFRRKKKKFFRGADLFLNLPITKKITVKILKLVS